LYAFIPRAANGTEASLEDLRAQLAGISSEWDRDRHGFGTRIRGHIDHIITEARWRPGLLERVGSLIVSRICLYRSLNQLRREGRIEGIPENEIHHVLMLARKAFRLTLLVTHYEQIGAFLSSWRYFHRWLALLMVLLVIIHVVSAVRYAPLDWNFLHLITGGTR
jgi:hypothetical protein